MAQGICTVCQSPVAIRSSPVPLQELMQQSHSDDLFADDEIRRTYGDSINYLCDTHDAFGQHCEGSGLIPQVVLKDLK